MLSSCWDSGMAVQYSDSTEPMAPHFILWDEQAQSPQGERMLQPDRLQAHLQ
jgi:hypothetical protein